MSTVPPHVTALRATLGLVVALVVGATILALPWVSLVAFLEPWVVTPVLATVVALQGLVG